MQPTLVVVIYDGLENSVFLSQVYEPLRKKLLEKIVGSIILVSFENNVVEPAYISKLMRNAPGLEIKIFYKKIPFWGRYSLLPAVWHVLRVVLELPHYALQARGPLAGWICVTASRMCFKKPTAITIQARGLLAEEYAYQHQHHTGLRKKLHEARTSLFFALENYVYSYKTRHVVVECVSPALKEYLITTHGTAEDSTTIAYYDSPPCIPAHHIAQWRTQIRAALHIPEHAYVYCYNGSAKPWQCPQKTVRTFMALYQENSTAFLLVLSQDAAFFERMLAQAGIPRHAYAVVAVPHHDIYKFLSAADAGFLLRDKHIINWISRPTKALEYQAVGLTVIHNGTVAWVNSCMNTRVIQ